MSIIIHVANYKQWGKGEKVTIILILVDFWIGLISAGIN